MDLPIQRWRIVRANKTAVQFNNNSLRLHNDWERTGYKWQPSMHANKPQILASHSADIFPLNSNFPVEFAWMITAEHHKVDENFTFRPRRLT